MPRSRSFGNGGPAKLFSALMEAIREGARESSSQLTLSLARILVEAGAGIDSEPHLKAYLNEAPATALATIVERRKGGISRFISDQVDSWDMKELIAIIEVNAGRALQYIRFNGTIRRVGGAGAAHGGVCGAALTAHLPSSAPS
jgi:uncharacterized membrane-anchored protein YjiN (DUF445 family)